MTVRDLIEQDVDIDVYDNVDESLSIAFVGPLKLTREGEDEFVDVLGFEIEIHNDGAGYSYAEVKVDDTEGVWQRKLKRAKEFFESAAGFCSESNYDLWFEED